MTTGEGRFSAEQIDTDTYHAETGLGPDQWLTRGCIHDYSDSDVGFHGRWVLRDPRFQKDQTEHMTFGKLFESIAQLGRLDSERFVVRPELCLSAKGDKVKWNLRQGQRVIGDPNVTTVEWEAYQTKVMKREVINHDDEDRARFMLSRFSMRRQTRAFLEACEGGEWGVVLRTIDEPSGLRFQCQLDLLYEGKHTMIYDLKKMAARLSTFPKTARNYGYDIQEQMYPWIANRVLGVRPLFGFAVAEDCYPYDADILQLPETQQVKAVERFERAVQGIKDQRWIVDTGKTRVPDCPAFILYDNDEEESAGG